MHIHMINKTATIFSLFLIIVFSCTSVFPQLKNDANFKGRTSYNLDQDWFFVKDSANSTRLPNKNVLWKRINLPHTWNAVDVMDDAPGYYRGVGWYKKNLVINPEWKNKQVYLLFDGANQETDVYYNGIRIGGHIGGYTSFVIPISKFLKLNGANKLLVKVNNRFNKDIAPLTADFTFFGGIYRNVRILVLDPVHFGDEKYGASGIYISAPKISKQSATINITGRLVNDGFVAKEVTLRTTVSDPTGKQVLVKDFKAARIQAGQEYLFNHLLPSISDPKLWSPNSPLLYRVTTKIIDAGTGVVLDEITRNTGLRWFRFDPVKGFFLNGQYCKLIGASRHQDYKGLGNALPADLQVKDVQLLKAMGGNYLRVAHYPQDQSILDACDELGILASVEIPIVNEITETQAFTNNAKNMQLEMIWQNYNHPSIIIWAYMNEVLLKLKFKNDKERQDIYLANVKKLAVDLDQLTRTTDSSRYTMIANHGDVKLYDRAGLTTIPMLVGWNLYQGWYGGKLSDFASALDTIHKKQPGKPFMVTEFGADVDPRIHAAKPERFDKSVEYGIKYHQAYLNAILKRPFVAGAQVWNLADFNSETREESMPHINNKGLLTGDRKPKNTYFLYQAYLLKTPFLKIGAIEKEIRLGTAEETDHYSEQPLPVYSNLTEAELFLNGKSLGVKKFIDHEAVWNVPFAGGKNVLKVVAADGEKQVTDQAEIDFHLLPCLLKSQIIPFTNLSISVGDPRSFKEENSSELWLPDQAYIKGSWGFIGGEVYRMKDNGRQSFGTDKNILGSSKDPIYQTQRIGLQEYRLDVPNGNYEIVLHFAELVGSGSAVALPYNLSSQSETEVVEQRIFSVYLNNKEIINKLDLSKTYGNARAVSKRFETAVKGEEGIRLMFKAIIGQAVLNGIQVKKI